MLTKNIDLIITPDDPFKNDCLDRKASIVDLTNLVQSTNQPFVFSIEAPWGWGKTTFVRLWKAYLEQEKHPCLYFNAWTNDFAEDPLIAFLSEMSELLEKEQDEGKNQALKGALRKAQKIGGGILRKSLPVALRLVTQGIIDEQTLVALKGSSDELGKLLEDVAEERIQAYEQEKRGMKAFRESLADFAGLAAKTDGQRGPVVFFVDELDRCRPDYAVALLERIKHLFNVEGVVFVLSIDRQQLVNSVKAIYGEGMDADGYLRRFLDISFRLPAPSSEAFCRFLFERFKLGEMFAERYKVPGYRHNQSEPEDFRKVFTELANLFSFSLRVQEQFFTEINIVFRTTSFPHRIYPTLMPFLVYIKAFRPDIYENLHQEQVNLEQLVNTVRKLLSGSRFLENHYEPMIAAYIVARYTVDREPNGYAASLRQLAESQDQEKRNGFENERARRIIAIVERMNGFDEHPNAITHAIRRLDSIGNFLK